MWRQVSCATIFLFFQNRTWALAIALNKYLSSILTGKSRFKKEQITVIVRVHQQKLDVAIVSVAEELMGDGLPGEVGVHVHVTMLQELELGLALGPATIPLHLVVAGERVGYQIYLISCLAVLSFFLSCR